MMTLKCIMCGNEFEAEVPWADCPHCAANYQRPPIEEPFPKADEPNTFLLELIIEDDKVAGFGGSPRAVMWLNGVLTRQKAYLSELADYGRTVERLRRQKGKVFEELRDFNYADPSDSVGKIKEILSTRYEVVGDDEIKEIWEED